VKTGDVVPGLGLALSIRQEGASLLCAHGLFGDAASFAAAIITGARVDMGSEVAVVSHSATAVSCFTVRCTADAIQSSFAGRACQKNNAGD